MAPVLVRLGYDPIWFGVLFVMNMQAYFLSPPFGPASFWLNSVTPPDITLQQIFAKVWDWEPARLQPVTEAANQNIRTTMVAAPP